jgi:hypothetical protein
VKRNHCVALLVLSSFVAVAGVYAVWTRVRTPESAAHADSYRVWIALLKGFDGDVYYVGNDETHAYFRLGRLFWSYYKVPACAAHLPEMLSVQRGRPYVVRLHVQSDNTIRIDNRCPQNEAYELGKLDRK